MDFFDHQDAARKRSSFFIFHFTMGVITVVATMTLLAAMVLTTFQMFSFDADAWYVKYTIHILIGVALATTAAILLASRWKIESLRRSGGHGIAKLIGGTLLPPNALDPNERKLLNVVEEMAIASSLPVPPVYLLRAESGINAFAAGYEPAFAVLGVTRGAIDHLTRDELQAVVGHEFSHILNGDMRLNIRLVGFIHGITVIGLTGQALFLISCGGGRNRYGSEDQGVFLPGLMLGFALMFIGYGGTFFGNIMKAAVCREREFLADASAVQFTRNGEAVVTALEKIGGYAHGSLITSPNAAMVSHMFFGQGISTFLERIMATHPPLGNRIRRIHPAWQGDFPDVDGSTRREVLRLARLEGTSFAVAPGTGTNGTGHPASAPVNFAEPRAHSTYLRHARSLIESIPLPLTDAGRKQGQARAALYSLLLARIGGHRQEALDHLLDTLPLNEYDLTCDLVPHAEKVSDEALLPFIDICMPSLSSMDPEAFNAFADTVDYLVRADNRTDFIEWTLQQALMLRLERTIHRNRDEPARNSLPLSMLREELATLLSCVAYLGCHTGSLPSEKHQSFARGMAMVGLETDSLLPASQCSLASAHKALKRLARAFEDDRKQILHACAAIMLHDDEVTAKEALFLRAAAGALDTPYHPVLPGQPLAMN